MDDLSPQEQAQLEQLENYIIEQAANADGDLEGNTEQSPLTPQPTKESTGVYSAKITPPDSPTSIDNPQEGTPKLGQCLPDRFYALIEDNTIKDIFKGDTLPEYNADQLHIMELPQGEEWQYAIGLELSDTGELVPLELEQIKERQLDFINAAFEAQMQSVQEEYIPLDEVLTFELQRQEASNLEGDTPFLDQLAQARGEDRKVLASKILKKHNDYMQQLATLLGKRHRLRDQVQNATSAQEVFNIRYTKED
ncbi:hypothetical protein [Helicobacter bizzozeronii]|uniref:hypothetical protein n=1 Tax=Helicobacter bizzozeronii TaxID=56877 RepID=UPI0018F8558F|nr:hypothetical protein [Helicobacter bizzozeronii]